MKHLTILTSIIAIGGIVYNNTHHNGVKYSVVEQFSIGYGEIRTLELEEDCLILKDGKAIFNGTNEHPISLIHQGHYKIVKLMQ